MFDKLRDAFSTTVKSLGERELKEKDIDDILSELEISLLESDVATEVIDTMKADLKKELVGSKVKKDSFESFIKQSLSNTISHLFDESGKVDLFSRINEKKSQSEPFIIMLVGINGTGKTTTLAKLGYLLKESKYSVVIAAADTFRAGAIEQLREHASRLNLKLIAQNYGSDPAAVCRDAVLYAKSHKIDCVLIDTAGRMQTSKNLMDQISKISKVVNPDLKIFVGDSLAGNDTVSQAREFHEHVNFDGAILTKSDADARGGAALSIVKITKKPIMFVGLGQEYGDLRSFNKEIFLETVLGTKEPQIESSKEPQIESSKEPQIESSKEPQIESKKQYQEDDPFFGIETEDINAYSDLNDIPPPENDKEASVLAEKIRKWIKSGRPDPEKSFNMKKDHDSEKEHKETERNKKKRSIFGLFKK